jgi:hypothetical protein
VILAQHVHPISDIQAGLATASSVALIETKAQADARQAILVAESRLHIVVCVPGYAGYRNRGSSVE